MYVTFDRTRLRHTSAPYSPDDGLSLIELEYAKNDDPYMG